MNQTIRNLFTVVMVFLFIFSCKNTSEPDTTPPQVSISSPANNASVRDLVTIVATVADNDGISKVHFLVDGVSIGMIAKSPYEMQWDTKQTSNGTHNIQCKAVDKSGNEALSDVVVVTVSNYLFKATFKNNWVSPDEQCVIFISDNDGTVLSEKAFSGNASFEMFLNDSLGKIHVKNNTLINVTTVVGDTNYAYISTNMNIPEGSSWTWKGYPSQDYDIPNTVDFNFQNMPDHKGYVLSSKWNARLSQSGTLSASYSYNFYETPMDIYLKLNTLNDVVKYIWLNNVVAGSRQDDLSTMLNATKHTINLQGSSVGYRKYLYGISNPGRRYEGRYRLDYGYDYSNTYNSLDVYYPASSFSDYRTSLYFYDDDNTDNFWYQSTYGEIPDNFTKINADFDLINTSYDNFEISANGDFLEARSSWRDDNYNYWYLFGDKTALKYKLPNFPNSVTRLFGLSKESFKLRYVDLIDHSELDSYYEILDILFKSENYFYDVVNDFRARVKYYNESGMLMKSSNELEYEKLYESSRYNH